MASPKYIGTGEQVGWTYKGRRAYIDENGYVYAPAGEPRLVIGSGEDERAVTFKDLTPLYDVWKADASSNGFTQYTQLGLKPNWEGGLPTKTIIDATGQDIMTMPGYGQSWGLIDRGDGKGMVPTKISKSFLDKAFSTILNPDTIINAALAMYGGPAAVAAYSAIKGNSPAEIAKSAALAYLGDQISQGITPGLTDTVGSTAANVIGNAVKTEVASGGKADPLQALMSGGVSAGTSAVLGQIDGFSDLSPATQKSITAAVSNTLQTGNVDPAKLVALAISTAKSAVDEAKTVDPYFQPGAGTGALPTDSSSVTADSGALPGINVAAADTTSPVDNTYYENNGTPSTTVEAPPTTPAVTEPTGALPATTETQTTTPAGGLPATSTPETSVANESTTTTPATTETQPSTPGGGLPATTPATDTTGGTYYENDGTPSTGTTTEPATGLPATGTTTTPGGDTYYENNGEPSTDVENPVDDTPEITITAPRPTDNAEPGYETWQPTTPEPTPTPTPKPALTTTTAPKTTTTTPSTTTATSTTTAAAPTTSKTDPFGVLPLDSSPQMLTSTIPKSSVAKMAELQQLFKSLTPEMQSVLSDRGITPPTEASMPGTTEAASGGLISDETSKILDSLNPKYIKSANLLPSVEPGKQEYRLGALKHLAQGPLRGATLSNRMASGGLPHKYSEAAPEGHNPEFITGLTGYYAQGGGTGQSDDIPAMLHDGDYVMDADTVAALGDGSSKAGAEVLEKMRKQIPHRDGAAGAPVPAKIADGEFVFPAAFVTAIGGGSNKLGSERLDEMREKIRAHKRSAPTSKIPPKAKSPLDYLKMAKG